MQSTPVTPSSAALDGAHSAPSLNTPVHGAPVPRSTPSSSVPAFDYRRLLSLMVQESASDLHLKVGCPPSVRINGSLVKVDHPALREDDLRSVAEQTMTARNLKEFSEIKECDYALGVSGVGRFRVNAYQQRGSIAYAFRVVPSQAKTIAELALPSICERIAMAPRGLVLVTGVTGSGKSTALSGMIQHINQNKFANIITIEDPIEFLHRDIKSRVNQREVGTDTTTFAQALRRVLRQDPDVILVGEIRDMETLDTALQAADTGHLVFSTLHTTDAAQTINRVLSFYPPHQQAEVRYMLSSALHSVVSLRLVPRADGSGRIPAAEVLVNTPAVRDSIRDNTKALNIPELIREGAVQYGMQSFDQSLMHWYTNKVITYESALSYATSPSEFALRVQGVAGASDTTWDTFTGASL